MLLNTVQGEVLFQSYDDLFNVPTQPSQNDALNWQDRAIRFFKPLIRAFYSLNFEIK